MKKVNIGIILILLAIIIFLFCMVKTDINKKNEIENAKIFLEEYFSSMSRYFMLEEDMRDIDNYTDREKYDKYVADMKSQLDKFVLSSKKDDIYDGYIKNLDNQYRGLIMFNKYDIEIVSYEEESISKDIIYFKVKYNLTVDAYKKIYPSINKVTERYSGFKTHIAGVCEETDDIIIQKLDDGLYKIIYHDVVAHTDFPFESLNNMSFMIF